MKDFEGVIEFIHVAEAGSFTGASKRLNTSVAHVSRQVSALEDRLGVKLFHRTTRKVSLSEVGQVYLQHCRPLVDGLAEAERAVLNLQEKPIGKLRFTAPVTYGEKILAPLLIDFAKKYDSLQIDCQLTNRTLDLIDGGFDLAIRLGKLEDSSMIAKKLADRTLHICASPQYLQAHGEPHTLSELTQHNCLLGTLDCWRIKENGNSRNIQVNGNMRCNNGPTLLGMAIAGHGIVQLPDYYLEKAINNGDITPILKKYKPDHEGIWAIYPEKRHLSSKIRLFIDFLSNRLAKTKKDST